MQTSGSIILVVNLFKVRTRIRAYLFYYLASRNFFWGKAKKIFPPFFFFFVLFCFFFLSVAVCGLGHRQISPSLSSLHVRTLLSRIAPCLCITFNEATNASGLPDTS